MQKRCKDSFSTDHTSRILIAKKCDIFGRFTHFCVYFDRLNDAVHIAVINVLFSVSFSLFVFIIMKIMVNLWKLKQETILYRYL